LSARGVHAILPWRHREIAGRERGSIEMMMMLLAALSLAPQAEAAAPVKEKKICRSIEVIGSNLPNRKCRTAAEWKAIDKANAINFTDQMQLQRMQNQGLRADQN